MGTLTRRVCMDVIKPSSSPSVGLPAARRPHLRIRAELVKVKPRIQQSTYSPTPLDAVFLRLFRNKMAQEAGWDSPKRGYDGLIEIANYLFKKCKDRTEAEASSVRILSSGDSSNLSVANGVLLCKYRGDTRWHLFRKRGSCRTMQVS
eukprot:c16027_g1_i1 orf=111-554(+)